MKTIGKWAMPDCIEEILSANGVKAHDISYVSSGVYKAGEFIIKTGRGSTLLSHGSDKILEVYSDGSVFKWH